MHEVAKEVYNFVYCTENIINGKLYIGVHRTTNLNDGYIGNGVHSGKKAAWFCKRNPTPFQKAVCTHGYENFKRVILEFFDTYEEALNYEKELVTIEEVKSEKFYNISLGGVVSPTTSVGHTEKAKAKMSMSRKGWMKGSQNIKAVLNQEKVDRIRNIFINNPSAEYPITQLSATFNVSKSTIRDILRNRTWRTSDNVLLEKLDKTLKSCKKEIPPRTILKRSKRTIEDVRKYRRDWSSKNKDRIRGYYLKRKSKQQTLN